MSLPVSIIVEILNSAIEFLLIWLYFNSIFERKYKSKWIYIAVYLLCTAIVSGANLVLSISWLNTVVILLLIVMIISFLYEGTIGLKILSVLLFILVMFLSDYFAITFFSAFRNELPFALLSPSVDRLFGAIISKIVAFWLVVFITRIWNKRVYQVPYYYLIWILLVPVFSVFIVFTLFSLTVSENQAANIFIMISVVGIIIINGIIFAFFEIYPSKLHLNMLNELVEQQQENYQQIEAVHMETRKLKHDMKNHLNTLKLLLEKQDYQTIESYLQEMGDTLEEFAYVSYTGNSVLDTILNFHAALAKQEGIEYTVSLKLQDPITLTPFESGVILGNALDNAIEACKRIQNPDLAKYIHIQIAQQYGEFVLSVANSAEQVIRDKLKSDKYVSMKADKHYHGFGLSNINDAVKKHNGTMLTSFETNEFTLRILIYDDFRPSTTE